MRHFALFLCVSAMAAMGGCILLEQYDYAGYKGSESKGGAGGAGVSGVNASSSSSGKGGAGGTGAGGQGGATDQCPVDVCGDGNPDVCRGKVEDCLVKSTYDVRAGGDGQQRIQSIFVPPNSDPVLITGFYEKTLQLFNATLTDLSGGKSAFYGKIAPDASTGTLYDIGSNRVGRAIIGDSQGIYIGYEYTEMAGTTLNVGTWDSTTGNQGWQKPISALYQGAASLQILRKNTNSTQNLYVAGTNSGLSIPTCLASKGIDSAGEADPDTFLLELNPTDGSCVRSLFIPNEIETNAMVFGDDIIVVGYSKLKLMTGTTIKSYVRRVSTLTGEPTWVKEFSAGNGQTVSFFHVATDGTTIYLAGTLNGTMPFGPSMVSSLENDYDTLVIALDGTGAPRWSHVYHGTALQFPTSLIADAQGLYMAGVTGGPMAADADNPSNFELCKQPGQPYCMFLLRMNSTGDALWAQTFGAGGESFDLAQLAIVPKTGDLWFAGGWTGANINFGTQDWPGTTTDLVLGKFLKASLP